MTAAIGQRIGEKPEGPDATALNVRREHFQRAIDELAPRPGGGEA
jgi:hypothetical protein